MRKLTTVLVLLSLMFMIGCSAHTHIIGSGAQGKSSAQERQWYILWGLVPLNDVETSQMAGGATDYTIKTEQSALDVIMNIFTSIVTVYSRTVTVEE